MKRAQVLTTSALFVASVYFLLPLWWLIVAANKNGSELFSTPALWFGGEARIGENLSDVFAYQDGVFADWIVNSLLYSVVGAAAATLLAAAAGYALAKYPFRGRGLVFAVIIGALLIPPPLLAVPQYLLASKTGMVDTVWSVLLPSMVSPFGVYLARVYADTVPDELLEAARVDGAGELRIFCTVGLRLMGPALVTIFLFQTVQIWNNFFLPLVMLADNKLWPLTLGLYFWNSNPQKSFFTLVIAGSLISIVPLVVAFLSLNRFWRGGMTAGAVKG
ncbi:carbohydrate ABC transporter permease [Spirillospora sp. CA-294931]|uniref:carbohydrate ABC transporter permease n=1 Tax=Spirillospora sp. CA-294931 TaxID=3240042 RepID=UPI003D909954